MALWIVRNVKEVSRLKFLVRTCPVCLLWLIKIDMPNTFITLKWRIALERLSIPLWVFAQSKNSKSHRKKRSAVLNTPEMKKKKKKKDKFGLFSISQTRHYLSVTGWRAHTPMNMGSSQADHAGWTIRFLPFYSAGQKHLRYARHWETANTCTAELPVGSSARNKAD